MPLATERVGRFGEYLTAAILSQVCDTVAVVPHNASADIVFEHNLKLYRCQVKTQSKIEENRGNWRFDMRKGQRVKHRKYKDNEIDLFAFVAVTHRNVVFSLPLNQSQLTIVDEHMKHNDAVKNVLEILEGLS
ncbi:group I intron-associated PD-(D/E)XK endonuclease [Pseudomonadales bacterium]|nr:group I intron-associated PD-(D/E)XK endonuclease [Pseudomonadales bacterium]